MKFFSFVSMCLAIAPALLPADSLYEAVRPNTNGVHLLKKDHCRRGPRGYRGRHGRQGVRGHRGHHGKRGSQGVSVAPAYLGRYYASETVIDISNEGTILTLGNEDGGVSPLLLQYTDLDPTDPTADKFVQVLPGGAGKYLIQYSVLVSVFPMPSFSTPLDLQLQIDHGSGYVTTMPLDTFEPFSNPNPQIPGLFISGAVEILVPLQDNDKVHIAVVSAPSGASIGGGSLSTRCVAFTMHRINT
jgi:hypothetical protein